MDVTQYRRPRGTSVFAVSLAATALVAALGEAQARPTGVLRLLTYNVAGLPEGVSRTRPAINVPRMGVHLDAYDLVLVQEDFAYQRELRAGITLPHCTPEHEGESLSDFGDGLSRFARHPFREHERRRWARCNGIFSDACDCLATKGFSVATHEIAEGVGVDVYNLHMDAGRSEGDRAARAAQIEQLIAFIGQRSGGRPVIVAGDTNLRPADEPILARLLDGAELRDACIELGCARRRSVDRVLYRSSPSVTLEARRYRVARELVDHRGRPLSDHLGVAVDLEWRLTASRDPRSSRRP